MRDDGVYAEVKGARGHRAAALVVALCWVAATVMWRSGGHGFVMAALVLVPVAGICFPEALEMGRRYFRRSGGGGFYELDPRWIRWVAWLFLLVVPYLAFNSRRWRNGADGTAPWEAERVERSWR